MSKALFLGSTFELHADQSHRDSNCEISIKFQNVISRKKAMSKILIHIKIHSLGLLEEYIQVIGIKNKL